MAEHCNNCEGHSHHHSHEHEHEHVGGSKEWIIKLVRVVVAVIFAVIGLTVCSEEKVGVWWNFAVNICALIIVGYDVVIEAVEDMVKEHEFFSEETLMILATIGAFCLRFFGPDYNQFFDAVMVMILFQIGEMLEGLATNKSKKAINDAIGLRAKVAHKKVGEEFEDCDPKDLSIGDDFLVRVGEIIPADGLITGGQGSINMSSLTGEFVPVNASIGDEVHSGTLLATGSLTVKVTKDYEDSTVSKIIHLIEEGQESKSKGTRFVDKFAKIYTPVVIALAILLAVIPPLFIGINDAQVWQHWVFVGISALIISCPCAIVISVPLCYFASLGLASKNGIVIKGANLLDKLNEINTLVTDKTGTLTKGTFSVLNVKPEGISAEELLKIAAIGESRSNHPLAGPLKKFLPEDFSDSKIEKYEELAGKGTELVYDGSQIAVGSKHLLDDLGIEFKETEGDGTIVYVVYRGGFIGSVCLGDTIRENVNELISNLHKSDIKCYLLTGDKESNAKKVSDNLGLDGYYAELLPEDKFAHLKNFKEAGNVAFVGDGVNDAPSIAAADVGFAMGGIGSDLAMESADIVIMDDDVTKVGKSIKIAKICRGYVIGCLIASLIVKLSILVLAIVLPGFPLLAAVAADTGLTLLMVLVSISILWRRA